MMDKGIDGVLLIIYNHTIDHALRFNLMVNDLLIHLEADRQLDAVITIFVGNDKVVIFLIGIVEPAADVVHAYAVAQFPGACFFQIADTETEPASILFDLQCNPNGVAWVDEVAVFECIFDQCDQHERDDPDGADIA